MFCSARSASLIFLVFASLLSGCSSTSPKPTDIHIYSEADAELNRDVSARPLSVVLYVYQLMDRQAFARLTFEDFLSGKTDSDLLGEELLSKTEHVMLPGAKESLQSDLVTDAKYVGIVAMYRQPAPQQWRYLIPALQMRKKGFWTFSKPKNISIRLHDCYMTVDGVEIDFIPGQRSDSVANCAAQTPNLSTSSPSPAPSSTQTSPARALPSIQVPTQAPSLPSVQVPKIPAKDQLPALIGGSIN